MRIWEDTIVSVRVWKKINLILFWQMTQNACHSTSEVLGTMIILHKHGTRPCDTQMVLHAKKAYVFSFVIFLFQFFLLRCLGVHHTVLWYLAHLLKLNDSFIHTYRMKAYKFFSCNCWTPTYSFVSLISFGCRYANLYLSVKKK